MNKRLNILEIKIDGITIYKANGEGEPGNEDKCTKDK